MSPPSVDHMLPTRRGGQVRLGQVAGPDGGQAEDTVVGDGKWLPRWCRTGSPSAPGRRSLPGDAHLVVRIVEDGRLPTYTPPVSSRVRACRRRTSWPGRHDRLRCRTARCSGGPGRPARRPGSPGPAHGRPSSPEGLDHHGHELVLIERCTSRREPAVHISPWLKQMAMAAASAASFRQGVFEDDVGALAAGFQPDALQFDSPA